MQISRSINKYYANQARTVYGLDQSNSHWYSRFFNRLLILHGGIHEVKFIDIA